MRALKVLSLSIAVAVLVGLPTAAQTSSTIEQEIQATSCNYTTIETGQGVTHDSTCPVFAPTIENVEANRGRPVVRGIYDAAHASVFRVRINNTWYVLGVDSELTANGNVWELDLSGLAAPLPEGKYAIIVEMRANGGELLQTGGAVEVVAAPSASGSNGRPGSSTDSPEVIPDDTEGDVDAESPEKVTPEPDDKEDEHRKPDWIIPLVIILAAGGAGLAAVAIRRYKLPS